MARHVTVCCIISRLHARVVKTLFLKSSSEQIVTTRADSQFGRPTCKPFYYVDVRDHDDRKKRYPYEVELHASIERSRALRTTALAGS